MTDESAETQKDRVVKLLEQLDTRKSASELLDITVELKKEVQKLVKAGNAARPS